MSKTSMPAAADVTALLTRAGFTVTATEAGYALDAAVDEFQRRINRRVIADGADVTHVYDPPGRDGFLDLRRDLSAAGVIIYSPYGGTSETLVYERDYHWGPYTNLNDAEPLTGPYRWVQFYRKWPQPLQEADRRSIEITGRWGMFHPDGSGMPDEIWRAVLYRAGALLLPEVGSAVALGRTQRSEAGVQTSWGSDPNGGVQDRWSREFERCIRRYRRRGIG